MQYQANSFCDILRTASIEGNPVDTINQTFGCLRDVYFSHLSVFWVLESTRIM